MEEEDDDDGWDRDLDMLDVLNEASTRLDFSTSQSNADPFEPVFNSLKAREQKFKDLEELISEESTVNTFDLGNYASSNDQDGGGGGGVLQRAKALLDTCERRSKYYSAKFAGDEDHELTDEMLLDDPVYSLVQQRRNLVEEFKIADLARRIEKESCRQQKNEEISRELSLIEEHNALLEREMDIEQQKLLEEIGKEGEITLKLIEENARNEQQKLQEVVHACHSDGRSSVGFSRAIQEAMISCETEETAKVDSSTTQEQEESGCLKTLNLEPEEALAPPSASGELASACLPESIDGSYFISGASRQDLFAILQDCIRNIENFGIRSIVARFPACLQRVIEKMHQVLVCEVNRGYDVGNILSRKLGSISFETAENSENKAAIVQKRVSRLIGKVLKLSVSMAGSSLPLTQKWKGLGDEAKQVGVQLALVHHARQIEIDQNDGATSIVINGKVVAAFKLDLRGRLLETLGGNSDLDRIQGSLRLSEEVELEEVRRNWEKNCFDPGEEKVLIEPDDGSRDKDDLELDRGRETDRSQETADSTQAEEYNPVSSAGRSSITQQEEIETRSWQDDEEEAVTRCSQNSAEEREEEIEKPREHDGKTGNPSEEAATEAESWEDQLLDPEETSLYSDDEWEMEDDHEQEEQEEQAASCSGENDRNSIVDDGFEQQATKIQALWRGHICRKNYHRLRERRKHQSICRIQAFWRGWNIRKLRLFVELRHERNIQRDSATKIQALWRGRAIRLRFKAAVSKIKYVDDDELEYNESIDCILSSMEDNRTFDQEEANFISHPAVVVKEELERKARTWAANAKTSMIIDVDFESSGTTPIEFTTPVHNTTPTVEIMTPTLGSSVDNQIADTPTPQDENQDQSPAAGNKTSEMDPQQQQQQKKKNYLSEIAKDWGFKSEKTVKMFMKACSKKRPSKDDAGNPSTLRDMNKRRSRKRFEVR